MMKQMLVMAAMMLATGAIAQPAIKTTLAESKLTDNWYIGVNGGGAAVTTDSYWGNHSNPEASLRVGRWLTPAFGIAVEGNAYMDNKPNEKRGTFVQFFNTSMMATVNLSNLFGGYQLQPRRIEVIAIPALGWGRTFGTKSDPDRDHNSVTSKMALDFAWNMGKTRAWQLFLEPAIVYTLNGEGFDGLKYNKNASDVQLNIGVNYKLPNSNGTHNFERVVVLNQYEIDKTNQMLNELRYDLREKEKALARDTRTISELREELEKARQAKPASEEEVPDQEHLK